MKVANICIAISTSILLISCGSGGVGSIANAITTHKLSKEAEKLNKEYKKQKEQVDNSSIDFTLYTGKSLSIPQDKGNLKFDAEGYPIVNGKYKIFVENMVTQCKDSNANVENKEDSDRRDVDNLIIVSGRNDNIISMDFENEEEINENVAVEWTAQSKNLTYFRKNGTFREENNRKGTMTINGVIFDGYEEQIANGYFTENGFKTQIIYNTIVTTRYDTYIRMCQARINLSGTKIK